MCAARFFLFQLAGHIICKHVFKISGNIPEPYASPLLQREANKARALQQRRRYVLKSWCSIAPAMGVEPNVYNKANAHSHTHTQTRTHSEHFPNDERNVWCWCQIEFRLAHFLLSLPFFSGVCLRLRRIFEFGEECLPVAESTAANVYFSNANIFSQ